MHDDITTLPVHPFTGLRAVGIVAGRPVWPIKGGSGPVPAPPAGDPPPAADPPPNPQPPTDPAPPDPPDPPKGDDAAGLKSALESERSLRKDAEKKLKGEAKLQARIDELESAGQSEAEKAAATARKEGHTEAMTAANRRLVVAEARALAAEAKFRDPSRAVRLLDGLDEVAVADDGTVDAAAIRKQLDELAKEAGYLLESTEPAKPPAPKPDPSQGPRGGKTTGTDAGREMFQARRKKPQPAP